MKQFLPQKQTNNNYFRISKIGILKFILVLLFTGMFVFNSNAEDDNDTATLTVTDNQAPNFDCTTLDTIRLMTNLNLCSNDTIISIPTAIDNCDGTITALGTRSDLAAITDPWPLGLTTITWTFTDAAGNSKECTQEIVVTDTIDTDNDDIPNNCDSDDDNDGILDIDEKGCDQPLVANSTSGSGRYQERIYFFNWSDPVFDDGFDNGESMVFSLHDGLEITATISNVLGSSALQSEDLTWYSASYLFHLYNTPGSDEVIGTHTYGGDATFTVTFVGTRAGEVVPLTILAYDGEASRLGEHVIMTTDGSPWAVLETIGDGGVFLTSNGGRTIEAEQTLDFGNSIFYSENASSIDVSLDGDGLSAVGFALYLTCDNDIDNDGTPDYLDPDSCLVQTDSVTQIGDTSATLYAYLLSGNDIVEYGFYYSTDPTPTSLVNGSATEVQSYSGAPVSLNSISFSYDVTDLTNRSAYYFRAYARDTSDTYYYGDVVRFISEKRDFSLILDGSGDCLVVDEQNTDLVINDWGMDNNTFSVEFWMKRGNTFTAKQVLISNMSSSGGYALALTNGHIVLENHMGATVQSSLQIMDEEWHHVTCIYDNETARIYIDESISSTLSISISKPASGDANCFVGAAYSGGALVDEFQGNLDAMRFWNVALSPEQVSELLYDLIHEGTTANTVVGVGSGKVIPSLAWESLTASLGFNVMSTQESALDFPANFDYIAQNQMHAYPFFHTDARLGADRVAFNVVAIGNARPSPTLPRVYWHSENSNNIWTNSGNWSGHAYPGEGVDAGEYPDVSLPMIADDSAHCKFTVVDVSVSRALVTLTPPEVQVLVDRDENTGTYRVDESASQLTVLQAIVPKLFYQRVENNEGAIIIEEGAVEVLGE